MGRLQAIAGIDAGYGYLSGKIVRLGDRIPGTNRILVAIVRGSGRAGAEKKRKYGQQATVRCMACGGLARLGWKIREFKRKCSTCKSRNSNNVIGDRLRMSPQWVGRMRKRRLSMAQIEERAREWNARGKHPWFHCKHKIGNRPAVHVALENGISSGVFYRRIKPKKLGGQGWSVEEAATKPAVYERFFMPDGTTAIDVAKRNGISASAFYRRMARWNNPERAATEPHKRHYKLMVGDRPAVELAVESGVGKDTFYSRTERMNSPTEDQLRQAATTPPRNIPEGFVRVTI